MIIRTFDHPISNLMAVYLTSELPASIRHGYHFRMAILVVRGLNLPHVINIFNKRDCMFINEREQEIYFVYYINLQSAI